MLKFDLSYDEAGIGAGEHVHLPDMLLPWHPEARLFNEGTGARRNSASASGTDMGYSILRRRSSALFDLMVRVAWVPFLMRTRVVERSPEAR